MIFKLITLQDSQYLESPPEMCAIMTNIELRCLDSGGLISALTNYPDVDPVGGGALGVVGEAPISREPLAPVVEQHLQAGDHPVLLGEAPDRMLAAIYEQRKVVESLQTIYRVVSSLPVRMTCPWVSQKMVGRGRPRTEQLSVTLSPSEAFITCKCTLTSGRTGRAKVKGVGSCHGGHACECEVIS